MQSLSLRARAVLGGLVWTVFALGISGYLLISAFDGIAERAFTRKLSGQLDQIETLIRTGALGAGATGARLADPRFQQSGSGTYFQIETPDGRLIRSASLGGESLPLRPDATREEVFTARAPEGFAIQVHVRPVTVEGETWRIYVAEALVRLSIDKLEFRRNLFGALIGLGASLILAAAAQTGFALRPLVGLRAAFWEFRSGATSKVEGRYPSDIEPLVDDINELLERNAAVIAAARRQAADLAHALKTPAAILRNEIEGMEKPSKSMREALERIETLMARYTARARLAGANAPGASADVAPVIHGLARLMVRVHANRAIDIDAEVPEDLRVRVESEDLEELIGNLIDNACKWAVEMVRVRARQLDGRVEITVEDDGPGIAEDQREEVLRAGARLDEGVPGTGLGLAICSDIVAAYGGELALEDSEMGGLKARVTLPRARAGARKPA